MKAFSIFIGKLPFAGKCTVRPLFSALYQSNSFSERLKSYLILMGVFVLMLLVHGMQSLTGILLVSTPNVSYWAILVGALYAIANLAVIVSHLYLVVRATKVLFSRRYSRRRSDTLGSVPTGEALLALVFTLGGQYVFLSAFYACIPNGGF